MNIQKLVKNYQPNFIHNSLISIYNSWLYKGRHSGEYNHYRNYFNEFDSATISELELEQTRRLTQFLNHASSQSPYYSRIISKKETWTIDELKSIPVLSKEKLVRNLDTIATIPERRGIVSFTGGTTGASLKVIYTKEDIQERFAALDNFRSKWGYKLGKKTAWFSGKDILSKQDIKDDRYFKDDWINKIRFYSTFHLNVDTFDAYWEDFCKFSPEYIVGFPSNILHLCKISKSKGYTYPHKSEIRVFFPTAETVTVEHKKIIEEVLGCPLINQYASAEGAPFIFECKDGSLHINPVTGVFEVVDDSLQPCSDGQILVTSFTTRGTPLIRYNIGDSIKLSDKICECGSAHRVVEHINGRADDYLYSPWTGKINLGNLSNITKDIKGIISFQAVQNIENMIIINIITDSIFNLKQEENLLSALHARFGSKMKFTINKVNVIPNEKSGKFRIVKNNLNKYSI